MKSKLNTKLGNYTRSQN